MGEERTARIGQNRPEFHVEDNDGIQKRYNYDDNEDD